MTLVEAVEGGDLARHHVAIELGRPAHRLAGVVDDEVEPLTPVVPGQQEVAERLDARRVAQIEAEDLEPVGPRVEVGLARVAHRRVARKARGHDQVRAGAQQLEAGLVTDLDPPAGEQRDAAAKVRRLFALGEVEIAASRAELVVEGVQRLEVLLAGVAVPRLEKDPGSGIAGAGRGTGRGFELAVTVAVDILRHETGRRKDIGRGHRRLAAQLADSRSMEETLVPAHLLGAALARRRLHQPPAGTRVGMGDLPRRPQQSLAIFLRDPSEEPAIRLDRLQQLGRGPHPLDQRAVGRARE